MNIEGINANKNMMDVYQINKTENNWNKSQGFDEALKMQKQEPTEGLDKVTEMIDNIEKVKVELENDLTVENLNRYKDALKSFLNHYTQNELQMESFYVKDGRTFMEKKVNIIKSIDENMNSMTENMLETNRGHLETLQKMGEIQGLIINLFI